MSSNALSPKISTSLKMLFASSLLAGLTLAACGSDDSGTGSDNENATGTTSTKKDAGTSSTKKDAGTAKKDGGTADTGGQSMIPGIATGAVEGEPCTGLGGICANDACDSPPCGTKCTDGVYEPCKPASSFIPMGGAMGAMGTMTTTPSTGGADAGSSSSTHSDAGSSSSTSHGDAGSSSSGSGDAGAATTCPAPNECSDPSKPGVASSMILNITKQAKYCTTGDGTGAPPVCANGVSDCVTAGLKNATCMQQFCIQLCK